VEKRLPKHVLTATEAEAILAQPDIRKPQGLRDRAILETFYSTGIRRTELSGLKIHDVDTERGTITVRQGKGRRDRVVPVGERAGAWMREESEEAGYLYVDGHVRTYTGQKANLPRRYVSRQRLCLRGTTDYWVNDALGRPFFVVSKSVSEGLAATLLARLNASRAS
jgi:prepilin-type processing-associated H-X9-DG protein